MPSAPVHALARHVRTVSDPDRSVTRVGVVTVGELAVFVAALGVAVVALASLATAHLRVLDLTNVALLSALIAAVLAGLAFVAGPRPRLEWDLPGLAVLIGVGLLAAVFFLPGYHYAAGDRDPGGYMMHGIAMARYGSYDIPDPLLADPTLPVELTSPGARFAGVWIADEQTGRIVPQFYHLWPALLATAWNLRGWGGTSNTTPVVGVLALMVTVALVRRVATTAGRGGRTFALVASAVAGVILATDMLEVWQAKYPSAEMLAQLIFVAASLGIVISLQTRWRWPAGVAGLLVGIGYLNRADGLLIVLLVLGVGCTLWVLRRFDARCAWFAVGLGVVMPYALWQAYGPAKAYTLGNTVMGLERLLQLVGGLVIAAIVLRLLLRPLASWVDRRRDDLRIHRSVGAALTLVVLALFALGVVRPDVFGEDMMFARDTVMRSYDEQSLYRLAWFLSWPALVLMVVGIAYVLLHRWRAVEWTVLVPLVAFLPLYAWHARNSVFLMWWGRRFVPTVITGIVIFAALAIAWLVTRVVAAERHRVLGALLALGGVATAGWVVAAGVQESWPLRSHDEWGNTYDLGRQIADVAGDQTGVFLWAAPTYCCAAPTALIAGPLWLIHDQESVLLPRDPAQVPAYVQAYADHFTDQPVFIVQESRSEPIVVPGLDITKVEQVASTLPRWEESSVERPDEAITLPFDVTVYRVTVIA